MYEEKWYGNQKTDMAELAREELKNIKSGDTFIMVIKRRGVKGEKVIGLGSDDVAAELLMGALLYLMLEGFVSEDLFIKIIAKTLLLTRKKSENKLKAVDKMDNA